MSDNSKCGLGCGYRSEFIPSWAHGPGCRTRTEVAMEFRTVAADIRAELHRDCADRAELERVTKERAIDQRSFEDARENITEMVTFAAKEWEQERAALTKERDAARAEVAAFAEHAARLIIQAEERTREACAKVADDCVPAAPSSQWRAAQHWIAKTIRALVLP